MKRRFVLLGSTARWPVIRGSLSRTACATSRGNVAGHSAGGRMLQAGTLCSPARRARLTRTVLTPRVFVAVLVTFLAHTSGAITLERVLQTTLDQNPAIQEAKSGLEQAAGQRLVFRSIVWPHAELGVPAGVQAGHRSGESGVKGFAVGRGALEQVLFNMAVPPSLRRGDVEVLIAQQKLNVAVVEQLHGARLAFYAALYNRSLESIRNEQRNKLEENVTSQKDRYEAGLADKSAFTSATVQASELVPEIESAHRAYRESQLKLAEAMAIDPAKSTLPEPEGEMQFLPMRLDVDSETAGALQRRSDLKLARLFVRGANEDQRIIAADYYPVIAGTINGEYVPVTGIHRQGSTSKTQDFIGSEIREKAAYTWWVIDNGKVGGAVLKARATREMNELTCRKLEANVSRELSRIANDLKGIDARERSLSAASVAAEESANTVRENVTTGLASPLEYRVSQNAFLTTRSGMLEAIYQHNVATAAWDRASGRYFQFSGDNTKSH